MVEVTVVGASGYIGSELLRLLSRHPEVEDLTAVSRSLAGKPVSSLHRNLLSVCDKPFKDLDLEKIDSDIVFFAAPPEEWFEAVPGLLDRGIKAVSMGGKFRIKDQKIDSEVYGGYVNPTLLEETVYGLPEMFRKEIRKARFIANPGCYSTSVILSLLPLEKHQKSLDCGKVVVNSISGSSGAGAKLTEKTHHPELCGNIVPYNVTFHRHTPEMEHIAGQKLKNLKVSFTPVLGNHVRGILSVSTIFAEKEEDYQNDYAEYYKKEPFVRVTEELPSVAQVADSNFCDICTQYDKTHKRLIIISVIDNLIKGGSGQAVQNMNIMLGLKEETGLGLVAGHP